MSIVRVETKGESFSANVAIGGVSILYNYIVPSRVVWRLRRIGNYLGVVAAWGVCYWRIEINGVRVPENGLIFDQIGYAAQRELLSPIVAYPGDQIVMFAVNPTAGIVPMGLSLGWDLEYGS